MLDTICLILVYAGSALMVFNIYRYIRFEKALRDQGGWEVEGRVLFVPIALLALFLLGYLAVGLLGNPDLVVASILFGGSIFVFMMIVFLERVAGRIQENERLNAKLLAAEESSRAKSSFLSVMSHEIRTPLNAIIGISNLVLRDPELTPVTHERLEKLDASAHHLLMLINDVLDMSRIDSGQMELSNEDFAMAELLGQVNAIIEDQCNQKGLDYTCDIIGDMDERYIGDQMKIKQVLINILGNAVKFTPAPGAVTFTAEQTASTEDRRTLRFVIADTGIGIDEEYLPNLFNAFTQEDAAVTSRYGGSGLGMAITKNLVEMMDGGILVESEKDVGTTFTVSVTLNASTSSGGSGAASMDESAAGLPEGALEGLCVLVAEDVDINAEILIDLLDMEGVEAERAVNGREAVDLFGRSDEGHYDAVLMDLRMPELDGLSAAREIRGLSRADAETVPIIAMTANAFDEDVHHSLQAGMSAHLSKPVDPDVLYETLARFCLENR